MNAILSVRTMLRLTSELLQPFRPVVLASVCWTCLTLPFPSSDLTRLVPKWRTCHWSALGLGRAVTAESGRVRRKKRIKSSSCPLPSSWANQRALSSAETLNFQATGSCQKRKPWILFSNPPEMPSGGSDIYRGLSEGHEVHKFLWLLYILPLDQNRLQESDIFELSWLGPSVELPLWKLLTVFLFLIEARMVVRNRYMS